MKDWKNQIKSSDPNSFEIGNIWNSSDQLHEIIEDMCSLISKIEFDVIAGIEMKGVIFASSLACTLKKPLIIFRKRGKITYTNEKYVFQFNNWKNEKDGLEIEIDQLQKDKKILVVDDMVYKLKSINAVQSIINKSTSIITGYLCFANLSGENELDNKSIFSLISSNSKVS
jgi:adenine phosphoribosyltransferase